MSKVGVAMVVILLSAFSIGCMDGHGAATKVQSSEKAYDSVSFSVCAGHDVAMIRGIHNIALEYGFTEVPDREVERLVGNNQDRIVTDVSYLKNSYIGIWLSDVSMKRRFVLMTFDVAFDSSSKYEDFRASMLDVIHKYQGCGPMAFTVIRGVPVRPSDTQQK